jgi:carbon monoxide dehydrogenase subunit G
MDIAGKYRIPASREHVWAALNDPEILRVSIPGCQELDKRSDQEFAAKVVAKIGPVRATFAGSVTLADLDPPEAYTISGQGQGGMAGFAKGSARVTLSQEADGETVLAYVAQRTSAASSPVSEIVSSKARRKRWLTSFLQRL